ncbi:MAG: GGDEF domain-containing protein, partial [Pirellulaceae bacterium]|nr:GGDEF domain-containing protein [Pirellulaceae bacterium]
EQAFFDCLSDAVVSQKPMTLAISDIDHFKKFNDTHGHAAGDEVLKHVAKLFAASVRPGSDDLVFRYGGEEFCMLLPNASPEEAMQVLEEYRSKVASYPLKYMDKELAVTVSVGLATVPMDGSDCKDLFAKADETLYTAKREGRNQIRHFAGGAKVSFRDVDLKQAIDRGYAEKTPE